MYWLFFIPHDVDACLFSVAMSLWLVSETFRRRLIAFGGAFYMAQLRLVSACQAFSCFVLRTPVEEWQGLWQLLAVDGSMQAFLESDAWTPMQPSATESCQVWKTLSFDALAKKL